MTIFKSKDFAAGKSDKARKAAGRKLGLRDPVTGARISATNGQVDDLVTQFIRELVEVDDDADWQSTRPAPDPM